MSRVKNERRNWEARYAAVRKFGNVMRVKEETREVWSFVWVEQLLQDIQFGLRMLRKSPGFAAVAILLIARMQLSKEGT